MVKSWIYQIDENRNLLFIQASPSNDIEVVEPPTILRDDAIVGLKKKKGTSENLLGVASRSLEIEFNLNLCPSDFVNEILEPTKEKQFKDYKGIEYDIYLKSGLVVYFNEYGVITFAGIHIDNYFDAEIDIRRMSLVVDFIELARFLLESYSEDIQRLFWTGNYKEDFLSRSVVIDSIIDFEIVINNIRIFVNRSGGDALVGLSIGSVAELLKLIFDDLCRVVLNRKVSWLIPIIPPLLYTRIENKEGKEKRGMAIDEPYIIARKNEKPFWFVSQNHKTFFDFFVDWSISCKHIVSFIYTTNDDILNISAYTKKLEELSWTTVRIGEAKRILIRSQNSDWVKVSLIQTAENGINLIEKRQFVSASGNNKNIVCLFDTTPYPTPRFVKSNNFVYSTNLNINYDYKFFYKEGSVFYRCCDLNTEEFDWYSYFVSSDSPEVAYYKGYKKYFAENSYPKSLLDYYCQVLYNNPNTIEIELETTLEENLIDYDNHLLRLDLEEFLGNSFFQNFCNKGIIREYSIDYISKRVVLTAILVSR